MEHGRSGGPACPEQGRAEFFRWLTANDDGIRAETRGDFKLDETSLDVSIRGFQQRLLTAGTEDVCALLTAVSLVHDLSAKMAQPNGNDSAYSNGVGDMAGTILHLLTVSLTRQYPHLAPDTNTV